MKNTFKARLISLYTPSLPSLFPSHFCNMSFFLNSPSHLHLPIHISATRASSSTHTFTSPSPFILAFDALQRGGLAPKCLKGSRRSPITPSLVNRSMVKFLFFIFGSCVLGLLGHVWHRFRVVPSFVLRSGYSEIGLCRDYIIQILFDNIILNYSVENMLSRTCLVTLLKFCSKERKQKNHRIYNVGPTFYYLQHSIIVVYGTHL